MTNTERLIGAAPLCTAFSGTGSLPATANNPTGNHSQAGAGLSVGTAPRLSSAEFSRAEQEVATIFTKYPGADNAGHLRVNEAAVLRDGKEVEAYRKIAAGLNHNPYLGVGAVSPQHAFGSEQWAKCTINFVVPVASVEALPGGWKAWLARGQYAKVISALVRVVGPAAIKGGVAGAVAALAAGAAWCSTPWAN